MTKSRYLLVSVLYSLPLLLSMVQHLIILIAVFFFFYYQWESQGVTHHRFARLNLVDLAGSER
jgi:hypothetical protein